jgi:hypothetical protein
MPDALVRVDDRCAIRRPCVLPSVTVAACSMGPMARATAPDTAS